MLKIIVVDDENITRQWIKKKIEELGSDYFVAAEFSNGRQALEYCKNHSVDVIFTDICMVNMDGMELLKAIGELGLNPYKVILSAYDEFQYARQALKLGVHEFILKPEITSDGIKKILEDAKNSMVQQVKKQEVPEKYRLDHILDVNTKWSEEDLCEYFKENHIMLENRNLVVYSMQLAKTESVDKIQEIFTLYMEEKRMCGYCFLQESSEYVIIYNHRNDMLRMEVAEELSHILQIHLGIPLFVGISNKKDGFLQIRELYRQAVQARENRYFFGITGCQTYDALQIENENKLYYSAEIKEILQKIEKEMYTEADEKMEELLEKMEKTVCLPPAYVKAICNELITAYLHKVREYVLDAEEEKQVGAIELLLGENSRQFQRLKENVGAAQHYISNLLKRKKQVTQYSKPIQEIVNYIEIHYKEKIVVENIAEMIHLSRTYISVLFKKETGEKFSDYLQRIRLEKSCEFLENTKLSIQEIAENTGFFDSAHFSRAFKDRYQCSPIEYRKKKNTKK